MIFNYKDFINEGIFSFLKKKKEVVLYQYDNIRQPLMTYIRQYMIDNNMSAEDAILPSTVAYMNQNLKNEIILIPRGRGIKAHTGTSKDKTNFEIQFNKCKVISFDYKYLDFSDVLPYNSKWVISIYDNNNVYLVKIVDVMDIKVRKKINRVITTEDPFGEEDWDE